MSNKSRLQTNNTNLQELINKAENLPDAGSGSSGGGIETCTVHLTGLTGSTYNGDVRYMTMQDGKPIMKSKFIGGSDYTLENVLSNSYVALWYLSKGDLINVYFSNGSAKVGMWNDMSILFLYDCTGEVEVRVDS